MGNRNGDCDSCDHDDDDDDDRDHDHRHGKKNGKNSKKSMCFTVPETIIVTGNPNADDCLDDEPLGTEAIDIGTGDHFLKKKCGWEPVLTGTPCEVVCPPLPPCPPC